MRPIILLPEEVANKIAAGEVIERPSSVVKELVENSIDAGANSIEVEARDGGKEYIRVTDNGGGIPPEYVRLAFERHATSKVRKTEDLFRVTTLGFRGEALPSIASVATVQMLTRARDMESGMEISLDGGRQEYLRPAGCPTGTTVIVRNLFFNTPARFKFLKQSSTERRYIVELVAELALANPAIALRLIADGQVVLSTPGNGRLEDCIAAVFGRKAARQMLPVDYTRDGVRVSGYVSNPDLTRGSRKNEVIIVNGRRIESRMIASALEKGYETFLPPKRFPMAVIVIETAPDALDVNVHPAKSEVRFTDEKTIYRAVLFAVKQAILGSEPIPKGQDSSRANSSIITPPFILESLQSNYGDLGLGGDIAPDKNPGFPARPKYAPTQFRSPSGAEDNQEHSAAAAGDKEISPIFSNSTILGQAANTYIVLAGPDGLVLVDQHAAHERILYEQFMRKERGKHSQHLLVPVTVEVSSQEAASVQENLDSLADLGLEIEPFGPNSLIVRSLPVNFRLAQTEEDIVDLIEELAEVFSNRRGREERLLIMMSCKGAVKANTPLTSAQMERLLQDLSACDNPYRCPHGRPTIVKIDTHELARRFGRE